MGSAVASFALQHICGGLKTTLWEVFRDAES